MFNEYKYQCKDASILMKPFKKFIVSPLVRFIPLSVPANTITIISNLFLYLALYISYIHKGEASNFIITSLLIFAYLVGDHLDGMQARRTATSSPLGEFCDHYLDIFNNGLLLVVVFKMFGITNIYIVTLSFFLSYLSHSAIFYEQYVTRWLIFEMIGSLEGVFTIILILGISYFKPVRDLMIADFIFNLRLIEIIMLTSLFSGTSTFFRSLFRLKKLSLKYLIYIALMISTTTLCALILNFNQTVLLLTFYNSIYIGNLMRAHLIDSVERSTDFITPLSLSTGFLFLNNNIHIMFSILIIYQSLYLIYLTYSVVNPLREFWHWINPTMEKV